MPAELAHPPPTQTASSVLIRSFPRLHVGLLDLGHVTARRYGGAGFTVSGPPLEVTVEPLEPGTEIQLVGCDHLDARARDEAARVLRAFAGAAGPLSARFTLRGGPPQHVGLGSKTGLLLALLQAAASVVARPLTVSTLQRLSGRGGASGIGIHTFFSGGFVVDAGHPRDAGRAFGPSSAGPPEQIPPMTCWLPIPEHWRFSLLVPSCSRIADDVEREVFREHTPLPAQEVLRAIATMHLGIVPAVATGDLELLGTSLADVHRCGFKGRELTIQPAEVREVYERIAREARLPVGLSSMGPLLYAVTSADDHHAQAYLRRIADEHACQFLGTHAPRNAGFEQRSDSRAPCGC